MPRTTDWSGWAKTSGTLVIVGAACVGLARAGDPPAAPAPASASPVARALLELGDADPAKRKAATEAIGAAWPEGAIGVHALVAALADDDESVRSAAASAIQTLGENGTTAASEFVKTSLTSDDPTGVGATILVAAALGSAVNSTDVAHWILQDSWGGALTAALIDLRPPGETGPLYSACALLLDLASGRLQSVKEPGAAHLSRASLALLGVAELAVSPTRPSPKGALELLRHPEPVVRWAGARIAMRWGSSRPEVLEALRQAEADATDSKWVVIDSPGKSHEFGAAAAQAALLRLEGKAPAPTAGRSPDAKEVSQMVAVLSDDKSMYSAKREALSSLARSAAPAPDAVLPVIGLLRLNTQRFADASQDEKGESADSLRVIETRGPDYPWSFEVRYRLVDVLGAVGRGSTDAKAALEPLAKSDDALMRYLAARALRRIESK